MLAEIAAAGPFTTEDTFEDGLRQGLARALTVTTDVLLGTYTPPPLPTALRPFSRPRRLRVVP